MPSTRTTSRNSAHYSQRRHLERAGDHLLDACVELSGFVHATAIFADFEHAGPATAAALADRHRSAKLRLEAVKRQFQAILTEQQGYAAEWDAHVEVIDREPVAHPVSPDERVATELARQFDQADGDREAMDRLHELLDRFGLGPDGPDWAEWRLEVRRGRLYWAPEAPPAPEAPLADPEPAGPADFEDEEPWPDGDDARAPLEQPGPTAEPPVGEAALPRLVFDPSVIRSVPIIADEETMDQLYDYAEVGSGAELTAHAARLCITAPDAQHRWAVGWSRPGRSDGDRRLVWYDPDKLARIHAEVQRVRADHSDLKEVSVLVGPGWDDWYITFTDSETGEDTTTGQPPSDAATSPGPTPATEPDARPAATPGPAGARPQGAAAGTRPGSAAGTVDREA